MRFLSILALGAAAMLSACSSVPQLGSTRAPAAVMHAPRPPPDRWTQGNAPKAHKDMLAAFSRGGLAPGEFVWAASVPQAGETRLVIDLLTQTAYAYRGEQLVGASSISSAK